MSSANQLLSLGPVASAQSLLHSLYSALRTQHRHCTARSSGASFDVQIAAATSSVNCLQIIGQVPIETLDVIGAGCLPSEVTTQESQTFRINEVLLDVLKQRKCVAKSYPQLKIGNTNFLLDSKKSVLYVQQRGFRTRAVSIGLQSGKQGHSPEERKLKDNSPKSMTLGSIFQNANPVNDRLLSLIGDKKSDKILKEVLEDVKKYETQLSPTEKPKLTEKVKAAYFDGYKEGRTGGSLKSSFAKWLSNGVLVLFFVYLALNLAGSLQDINGMMSSQNEVQGEKVDVSFNDVCGVEEAKSELQDIVAYLRDPDKFSKLGGRLPKGVLLVGPPGTGKTLLARAIAGEADVPFYQATGSEFDEVLVGTGAKRVRKLFATAKQKAPCVIFLDEIDSVGGKRSSSALQPFANQTINQLLSEMDGFHQNQGVIVIGATNRKQDLDKALLRPGRFDIEVFVSPPDRKGRKEILQLYLDKVTLAEDVDVDILSRRTTGCTGADIESIVNQAALKAARDGMDAVGMAHLEEAYDRVLMGPERKAGRLPCEETNKLTAYHEAGHTIVCYYTKDASPLHKVTIIPRGTSLGLTQYIPDEKEMYGLTRSQILAIIDVSMGGRAAEELEFGKENVTTGCTSDLKTTTEWATGMVKIYGMCERVGFRDFSLSEKSVFAPSDLSPNTMELIDSEIKRILHESYERATALIKQHAKEHRRLAETLLEHETLNAEELKQVIEGKPLTSVAKK